MHSRPMQAGCGVRGWLQGVGAGGEFKLIPAEEAGSFALCRSLAPRTAPLRHGAADRSLQNNFDCVTAASFIAEETLSHLDAAGAVRRRVWKVADRPVSYQHTPVSGPTPAPDPVQDPVQDQGRSRGKHRHYRPYQSLPSLQIMFTQIV